MTHTTRPIRLVAAVAMTVSLVGCQGRGAAGPSDAPTPQPFAAPQPAAASGTGGTPPQNLATVAAAASIRTLVSGRRAGDLGEAVAAALPVGIEHLGGPARAHVQVEAVDAPGPGAAVVVLLGVELRDGRAHATRLAVPVVRVDGHWAAGQPWRLPAAAPPRPDTDFPVLPSDDPALRRLAVDALARAGWQDVTIEALGLALDSWPHVVTFSAADRNGTRSRQTVWLRRHLDQLVLAGTTSPSPAQPTATQQEQTP